MDAIKRPVTDSDDLANLRRQVLYGLTCDSVRPTTVFMCVRCGTIIGFTDNSQLLDVRDVDCPECGAFNTLNTTRQAAELSA